MICGTNVFVKLRRPVMLCQRESDPSRLSLDTTFLRVDNSIKSYIFTPTEITQEQAGGIIAVNTFPPSTSDITATC